MEHRDERLAAIRSFFVDRMQLTNFDKAKHWHDTHSVVGLGWMDNEDKKALYMWMNEDGVRIEQMSGTGESESRIQDRLPPLIRQGVVTEFMYFYKRDQKQCTLSNLNEQVMFGCSRGELLENLLGLMNHVYVPVSLAHQGWPDNVKKDFTAQVQKFMSTVTEMTAQGKGQTVLYIPQDNFTNLEAAAKDKDIVQRLEMALIYWTRQIKEVTTQQDSATEGEHSGPLDEIEFWHKRDNNLSRLHDQLQSANLQRLLSILEKSAYLKEFRSLEERIRNGSIESKENLKFLSFLKEPCMRLSEAAPPDIPKILPNLLNYVRMIWSVSSYYRKEDRISGLLRKMSNEIIKRCQSTIQLDDIFKNKGVNVESSMEQLQQCIDCGREWKLAYQKMTRLISKYSERSCNFSDSTIFVQIDAFVQRCCDLLEVCEGLLQFACYSRGQPMPVFGGTRAMEIEKSLRDIEEIFMRNLERLENVDYDLLNVTASGWQDDITTFRNGMRDLEVMYVNVINSSFDGVGTVQGAVEVLDAFYLLAKREKIKIQIMKKGEHVYNLFSEELNKIKREFEHLRRKPLLPIVQGHPIFAGTALWVKGLMRRIENQMDELKLLCYLEPCREQDSAKELYSNVHSLLEAFVLQTFGEWVAELKLMDEANLQKRLQIGLLTRAEETVKGGKSGMLESNFDKELLKMFQEVYYWEKIQGSGIVVPYAAHEIASQRDTLRVLREHVLRVVRDYNQIISALTPEEHKLFKEHLRKLDRRIGPGFGKWNWTYGNQIKDSFGKESCKECNKVYDYVKNFKRNNAEISVKCKELSELHLIQIEKKAVHRDDEFRTMQEKCREKMKGIFQESHAKITDLMMSSNSFFETHPNDIQREWRGYVDKIDKKIEEALKKCVKTSLQELCRALNGDTKTEPSPLFRISGVLEDVKMDFKPPMNQLKDLLQLVCRDMTMTLIVIPRLDEHLFAVKAERDRLEKEKHEQNGDLAQANAIHVPTEAEIKARKKKKTFFEEISKDDDCCIRYVKDVLRGFNNCAVRLGEQMKRWNSLYQPIVSQDKDTFIRRYKKTERSLAARGQDIQRYKEVQNDIQAEEPKDIQEFIEVDWTPLKSALMQHCQQWQNKLTDLLNENARQEMTKVLEYFETNTKTLLSMPMKDMDELKMRLQLLEQCRKDDEDMENRIAPIEAKYAKLQEFEVVPADEELARKALMRPAMDRFRETLGQAEVLNTKEKKKMKAGLEQDLAAFAQSIKDTRAAFQLNAPYKGEGMANDQAFVTLNHYKAELAKKRAAEEDFAPKLELFGIEAQSYKDITVVDQELEKLQNIWEIREDWDQGWNKLKTDSFRDLNCDDMDEQAVKFQGRCRKLVGKDKSVQNWGVYIHMKQDIDVFRNMLPLITCLRQESMRDRHFQQIIKEVGEPFDPRSEDFNLQRVMDLKLVNHSDLIAVLADDAKKEAKIENGLESISKTWATMKVDVVEHKGTYFKLRSTEDLYTALEEHILQLSGFKSSQFYLPFASKVEHWESTLANISEVCEAIQAVQKSWMYLENIFVGSEDIRPHLPEESVMFDEVNAGFTEMLRKIFNDPLATKACSQPNMLERLNNYQNDLEKIQKSLNDYLEKKRQQFPRFYFLSNDDLLEILGQARDPELVQKHIKKCFEGIKTLELAPPNNAQQRRNWECTGFVAPDGERVKVSKNVVLEGPVEVWLGVVEKRMVETLRKDLNRCHQANINPKSMKKEKWVKEFQGQLLITSGQIAWTSDCVTALRKIEERGQRNALKSLKKTHGKYITQLSVMIRKPGATKIERSKLVALITIEVHNRDVQEKMSNLKTESASSFNWTSQLRFELRVKEDEPNGNPDMCYCLQTNTCSPYGYEYQGNNGRLVVTPMTDRCYMTLTTAMHLKRGGAPAGPAGTGKTESVKDLGKGLAMYVIVFNCSDGLDFKSLGRMFSGLAQSGAWGCFDEFNRIDVTVLSVVAVQIMTIQAALREEKTQFMFEERMIKLVRSCAIFITMNPGYAGRSELPDNLKALFRPVAMMVPEFAMIMEIMLVSEGYKDFKMLAKKMYTLYMMMQQQMSKQDHYDFGLRNIKSVLGCAGALKRKDADNQVDEQILLMRAINDMNAPKWVSQDVPLYTALLADIFPGLALPTPDYGKLEEVICKVLVEEFGCQRTNHSVAKCISIYETKITRHGNMLVGGSLGGKSVCWKTLARAKSILKTMNQEGMEKVKFEIINPKAVSNDELYGAYDLSTMEWTDGVLSAIMRGMCQDEKPDEKWLILDGPVDTLWIESMNTVLDDNKVLTLINGDRIGLPPTIRLLFEVGDLSVASPATVSRAGMVYFDPPDLGWQPFFTSWVEKFIPAARQQDVKNFGEKWIHKIIKKRHHDCTEIVPILDTNGVQSLTRLWECVAPRIDFESHGEKAVELMEKVFAWCIVWSLGGSVAAESRQHIDACMRETDNFFPPSQTVYEYSFNPEKMDFSQWEERMQEKYKPPEGQPFHKIIVPTVDTQRNMFILNALNAKHFHSLLVGTTGTGKTVAVQQAIANLDDSTWTSLTINFSAMTSSNKTQDIIENKIEKRIKNKFGPPGNKRMLTFVDDLNMPRKDTFGSQPPLELLRQWMDYECWYDRKKQTLRYVLDMHLACAMGQPGGGRAVISSRIQSGMNNICFVTPAESQIKRIFLALANHKLGEFRTEDIKGMGEGLTMASIHLFNLIVDQFLPTPEKSHYLFNLRDVSKIFQGVYLAHPRLYEEKEQMLRLWYHECCRVFMDRLINMEDRDKLRGLFDKVMEDALQSRLKDIVSSDDPDIVFAGIDLDNPQADEAPYEHISERKKLKTFMEGVCEDYNSENKKAPMSLVMFKDAIEQCCKILRIIRHPRGNALLVGVGGSGRHCLSRLASFIAAYKCFQVEITKQYKHASFHEDLKKLYERAGSKAEPVTFLFSDTEIMEEKFLEDVANLLSSGEVPNIYSSDELSAVRQSVEKPAKEHGVPFGPEALYDFFLSRVRENLHVVFCLSFIGESFRDYCRMYPALVSCTTIIWFLPWPTEALTEVAMKFLREGQLQEEFQEPISVIFGRAHSAVYNYSARMLAEQKRTNYVTPTNYLELVTGYMSLLREKQKEIGKSADKLRNGLNKLDEARVSVGTMSAELEINQDICVKKTKECEELLHIIVQERSKADQKQTAVEADSLRIEKEAKETKIISDDATRDLEKAMPALDAALDALEKLDKKAISEVKAYAKPPDMVMKTMCAVMTVMEKTPSWAQAKTELNETNFLYRIKNFDKDGITNATLRKIEKYTKDVNFTPKLVTNVSSAAGALCQWVHAMKIYAEVYREVEPKRLKLKNAQESLEKKNRELEKANAELAGIQQLVQNLKDQYESSNNEKEEQTQKAEEMKIKLERAEKLMSGLAGEKGRWEISLGNFDTQQDNLFGDCVISSAFMSYAGPFGATYREKLVLDEWIAPVKELKIAMTPGFSFANFMAKPTDVRDWNLQGLPTDSFSTENGVLSTRSRRFPLLIDPQNQGNKWVRKMEGSDPKRQLRVFDPNSKDIMRAVERAIEYGLPILLENVKEDLDPSLEPVLAKNVIEGAPGSYSIKVGEATLDYNWNFKFYITTKLANPHYTPEVSTKTTIVNFIVVQAGLTDQLLGVVVSKEEPNLEKQKNELVVQVAKGKNRLVELESEILRLLAETKGSLLDDLSLIDTLQESKVISESVTEQVNVAEQTMVKIDAARENYRPAGFRSAVLYFVLNDLVTIDPMYQFALDAYSYLYVQSIEKSADKKISVGSIDERIEDLNSFHALAVYRYACRALFERHKLLFSLHLCSKILQSTGELDMKEYMFFLFGGQVIDRSSQPANPADWISQATWDNIVELDANLETFKGFQSSFEQTLRDWKKWYSCAEPEKEALPGDWDGRTDPMQKLIIIRCIRPDRVTTAVGNFIASKLDQKFVEPPPLDLEQIYEESSAITPLLFVLTPGMDPTNLVKMLATTKHQKWEAVSLGQGQEGKATRCVEEAAKNGSWGLLANCHLCVKWLPDLEKVLSITMENNPHKMFRIFLSSSPTPLFPIQLLQGSIKMTCEPPKGLKPNMMRLLQNFPEDQFNRVHETQKYRKLFFSLVWFHAVLLERRKFKMLGWNVAYDFNDSDFDICENLLAMYLDENPNEIPWEAIRYLIADANYGGRVTEHPDNRVLRTYAHEYFSPNALTPKFMLSALPTYYIPEENSLQNYRNYSKDLPMQELPEAFGQHVNAEISSLIQDTIVMTETIISMEVGGGGSSDSKKRDEMVMSTCESLLGKIPEEIDREEVAERTESDASPLRVCLLQEIERYVKLLVRLKSNIKLLIKGIQGFVVISKDQEEVMSALFEGRVPAAWLFAYPSLKPLGSWVPDLIERIAQLNVWAFDSIPKVFWLGGLTYPTSFNTALLQASARKNMIPVDALVFDFIVQAGDESTITAFPKEGSYFKNMTLEGAKWDMNLMALADAETMQLFSPMPIIHFKPVNKKKNVTEGFYSCPLYLYPVRTGSRERPSFMQWVELKAGQHDGHFWIKRGTALLLSVA